MAGESDGPQIDPGKSRNIEQNTDLTNESTQMPNLPSEIIHEVLARLPVKTLLRFRTNTWRRIEDFLYGPPHDEPGRLVSGALNWPSIRYGGFNNNVLRLSWVIVALDLEKETYMEVPQPKYGDSGYDRTLGVLGGCLSILCNYHGSRGDVWVMKEYGLGESWTKLLTIPYVIDLFATERFPYYWPLFFSKDGEMLFEFASVLTLYNSKDNTFRFPVIHSFPTCLNANFYVESLVSPNAADRVEEHHQL